MLKTSTYKVLWKCCYKLDHKNSGYMYNGKYVENISAFCWKKIDEWKRQGIEKSKYELIEILCNIKRFQKGNWKIFNYEPPMEQHSFKKSFVLDLSEIEPYGIPHIKWNVHGIEVYETYIKL